MDFKKMRSFISLAETGSFSKAADAQFMAQSTFSAQIKSIEDELGVSLVNRDNKRMVTLTAAGDSFLEYSRRTLSDFDDYLHKLHAISKKQSYNIGLFYCSRLDTWTQAIATHNAFDTEKQYGVIFSYGEEKRNALRDGTLGVALSARSPQLEKEGFTFRHVFYDYESLGIPYSHPLAKQTEIDLKELRNEKIHCVSTSRTFVDSPYIRKLIEEYGLTKDNFVYERRIGDLHFVTKTKGEIIMQPAQLLPQYVRVWEMRTPGNDFRIDYGWYYREENEDLKWVIENLV